MTACGISTSTPERDAAKIIRKFEAASSPREREEALQLYERYMEAYQEEVFDGKRSVEDLKTLTYKVGERM